MVEIHNALSGSASEAAPGPLSAPKVAPKAKIAPQSGMERAMHQHADTLHKVPIRPGKVHPLSRK